MTSILCPVFFQQHKHCIFWFEIDSLKHQFSCTFSRIISDLAALSKTETGRVLFLFNILSDIRSCMLVVKYQLQGKNVNWLRRTIYRFVITNLIWPVSAYPAAGMRGGGVGAVWVQIIFGKNSQGPLGTWQGVWTEFSAFLYVWNIHFKSFL